MKTSYSKYKFSFSHRLLVTVVSIFVAYSLCFILFQYQREKAYKVQLLNTRLQDYNYRMAEQLMALNDFKKADLDAYVNAHVLRGLRVTLVRPDGTVVYDSYSKRAYGDNHANRDEIKRALKSGSGYSINRLSKSVGENYFYSATFFSKREIIIRTALPYSVSLLGTLSADTGFLWFAFGLTLILILIFYRHTRRLGDNIIRLKEFALRVDAGKSIDEKVWKNKFPNNELGEISQHIVGIYYRLERNKEDKARLKRQLTQNIAHELKTPVSSIQGYLETLVTNADVPEKTKKSFLEHSYAQSKRLASLLRDISVLTRIDEAPDMYDAEPVDIAVMVRGIEQEVVLQLNERKMYIKNNLPEMLKVKGNASLIYSIFRNLTDNAIVYAGEQSTITIRLVKTSETHYTFSFSDNGIGVEEIHLNKLFERFYRVDKGRSRKMGGTGLGLAIVKNAVILHQGRIKAEKETEGGGLSFVFSLAKDVTLH
jgi:signal transduction histidine kinase